jgi:hypothetical protein
MKAKEKSRSQIIREYLLSLKPSEQSPTKVSEALKEKGVNVTVHHIGMVKLHIRRSLEKKREKNRNFDSILIAKSLLKHCNQNVGLANKSLEIVFKLLSEGTQKRIEK